MWLSQIIWKKSPLGKNDQKRSKMAQKQGFFWLFKELMSLVLSVICVKWKLLCFINILEKLLAWEKPGSQVIAKNGSANEILVFFNCQYFTNRLIFHFDFWNIDRHEWKEQDSLRGILKKNLIWANRLFYGRGGAANGAFWARNGASHNFNSWIACKSFL